MTTKSPPRQVLIEAISDNIRDAIDGKSPASLAMKKKTLLTAAALANIFTGELLNPNTDLNMITAPTIVRYDASCLHCPPANCGGVLQVIGPERDAQGNPVDDAVRQVAYPESLTEYTPYTRVRKGTTWSEWSTLGGQLRRIKLTTNTTGMVGTHYDSYGNYTLTLPTPDTYPVGTGIILEQYKGKGKVVCGEFFVDTEPDYVLNDLNQPTAEISGSTIYAFEVSMDDANNKEWLLTVDNNFDGIVQALQTQIGAHLNDTGNPHQQYFLRSKLTNSFTHAPGTVNENAAKEQAVTLYGINTMHALVVKYQELLNRGIYPNGKRIEPGTSLNTITEHGFYYGDQSTVTNVPPGCSNNFVMQVIKGSDYVGAFQVVYETVSAKFFYRTLRTGSATTWSRGASREELVEIGVLDTCKVLTNVDIKTLPHGTYYVTNGTVATVQSTPAVLYPTLPAKWEGVVICFGRGSVPYMQIAMTSGSGSTGFSYRYIHDAGTTAGGWRRSLSAEEHTSYAAGIASELGAIRTSITERVSKLELANVGIYPSLKVINGGTSSAPVNFNTFTIQGRYFINGGTNNNGPYTGAYGFLEVDTYLNVDKSISAVRQMFTRTSRGYPDDDMVYTRYGLANVSGVITWCTWESLTSNVRANYQLGLRASIADLQSKGLYNGHKVIGWADTYLNCFTSVTANGTTTKYFDYNKLRTPGKYVISVNPCMNVPPSETGIGFIEVSRSGVGDNDCVLQVVHQHGRNPSRPQDDIIYYRYYNNGYVPTNTWSAWESSASWSRVNYELTRRDNVLLEHGMMIKDDAGNFRNYCKLVNVATNFNSLPNGVVIFNDGTTLMHANTPYGPSAKFAGTVLTMSSSTGSGMQIATDFANRSWYRYNGGPWNRVTDATYLEEQLVRKANTEDIKSYIVRTVIAATTISADINQGIIPNYWFKQPATAIAATEATASIVNLPEATEGKEVIVTVEPLHAVLIKYTPSVGTKSAHWCTFSDLDGSAILGPAVVHKFKFFNGRWWLTTTAPAGLA